MRQILTSRLSLSKHLAHNLGNLLLLGKIGVFHNRRNASSRLLLLISKHLILCIYLVFRIQSATSRQNTKDQVYAQNEMLAYQQKESTARVASIMENTNLSKQQQVSEIMRQMLTQAQTAGQYFTNEIGRASCRERV